MESITPGLARYVQTIYLSFKPLISAGLVVQDVSKQEGDLATSDRDIWRKGHCYVVL